MKARKSGDWIPIGLFIGLTLWIGWGAPNQVGNSQPVPSAKPTTNLLVVTSTNTTFSVINPPSSTNNFKNPINNVRELVKAKPGGYFPSRTIDEIVKMAESGVENRVIQSYVENVALAAPPSANEIIYLRDHGINSETILALIRRGKEIQERNALRQNQFRGEPYAYRQATPISYFPPSPSYSVASWSPYAANWRYLNNGLFYPYYYWWSVNYPWLGFTYVNPRRYPLDPPHSKSSSGPINPSLPGQAWSIPR